MCGLNVLACICVRYLNAGAFFTKAHAENFVRRVSTLVADEQDVAAEGNRA